VATADPQDVIELEKSLLEGSTRSERGISNDYWPTTVAYDKRSTIEALVQEHGAPSRRLEMIDARLFELAAGVCLLAYRLVPAGPREHDAVGSLRSSTWIWRDGRWQMLFHQGTAAATGR
jgi:hypothetical protein